MNAEPLRIALSKIAPLEKWEASWSQSRPKICWELFRPNPQHLHELWRILGSFHGQMPWHLVENCLVPGIGIVAPSGQRLISPTAAPTAALQINEADVTRDLAALANEIEIRLNLRSVKPMSFSGDLLTKEGLRKSNGPFEDFADGGQRTVYLIVKPAPEIFEETKNDIMLHFEPKDDEMTAIFGDIVGADLTKREFGTITDAELDKIEKGFPVLLKISNYSEGAYLTEQDVQALSQECGKLDPIVHSSKALRGLDKVIRIANWASARHYGVLFSEL